jgi:hypothetical protein
MAYKVCMSNKVIQLPGNLGSGGEPSIVLTRPLVAVFVARRDRGCPNHMKGFRLSVSLKNNNSPAATWKIKLTK